MHNEAEGETMHNEAEGETMHNEAKGKTMHNEAERSLSDSVSDSLTVLYGGAIQNFPREVD